MLHSLISCTLKRVLCGWFLPSAIVEVPEEYVGPVLELLGRRRGAYDRYARNWVLTYILFWLFLHVKISCFW